MNQNDTLILTPLEKAIRSLEDALAQPKTIIVRDATIQRFEYTFGLAIKILERYFQQKRPSENIDALTYNDLCRAAAEAELITDPRAWFEYRDARNMTSHAYDEALAEKVYAAAKKFLPDVQRLLEQLQQRV